MTQLEEKIIGIYRMHGIMRAIESLQRSSETEQNTFPEEPPCFSFIMQRMEMPEEQKQNKDKILVTKKGFKAICCDGGYALYSPYINTLENDMQRFAQQVNEILRASGT